METVTKHNYESVQGLEGRYVNQHLWSDVNPVGKIISTRGKNFVTIQPMSAGENKTKMEFVVGGFSGHCINQYAQKYDFFEDGEPYEVRISKTQLANRFWVIENSPCKYYDYNF